MSIDHFVGGGAGFLIAWLFHSIESTWRPRRQTTQHRELVRRLDGIADELERRGLVSARRDLAGHVLGVQVVIKDGVALDGSGEYRTHSASSRESQSDQGPRL
jgi:hypothetical protein